MTTAIEVPEDKLTELAGRGASVLAQADSYTTIATDQERDGALQFSRRILDLRTLVGALLDEPIAQAHKLHKSLCTRRNVLDAPLADAQSKVARGIGNYEARKRAEIDAKRAAEEAERRRLADEAEAALRKAIEDAKRDEDARLETAAALEAAGLKQEADAVLATPAIITVVAVPVPVVVDRTPAYKPPAASTIRTNWKFRIVNAALIPRDFLIPDESAIGAYVRSRKDDTAIPGIEVYCEASASLCS